MKKLLSLAILWFACLLWSAAYAGTWCLATGATSCSTTTLVQVQILPGNICIGSSGTFDFGTYTVSSSAQTVNSSFTAPTGYFYVDDLKGADTGYYTTVQLSGDLIQSWWAGTIPAANVFMKTPAVGNPWITLLAGTANPRVVVNAGMIAYQSLDVARRLIERPLQANFWVVGKYATLPEMQLIIPAYQSVGTYTATLVYTLYEN